MADSYGPFSGTPWAEADWFRFAPAFAPDGVLGATDFTLTPSGLSVTVGTGRAWVGGTGFRRYDSPGSTPIPANTHSTYSRRDRVVLRRSLTARTVTVTLLQGTAAVSPTAPALTQNVDGNWAVQLWSFLVPPNSGTAITGIIDERVFIVNRPLMVGTTLPNYAPEGALFFQVK